jgi:hypothetical protein
MINKVFRVAVLVLSGLLLTSSGFSQVSGLVDVKKAVQSITFADARKLKAGWIWFRDHTS